MINYNESNLMHYEKFLSILEYLGGREPTDEEVWEIARESQEIPIFANILYYLVLSEIEYLVKDQYSIDLTYFINAIDTHLYFNGDQISDLDDFQNITELQEVA